MQQVADLNVRFSRKQSFSPAKANDRFAPPAADTEMPRACLQLSQMIAAASWIAARKFLAVLS
jgi:hypothetical protein